MRGAVAAAGVGVRWQCRGRRGGGCGDGEEGVEAGLEGKDEGVVGGVRWGGELGYSLGVEGALELQPSLFPLEGSAQRGVVGAAAVAAWVVQVRLQPVEAERNVWTESVSCGIDVECSNERKEGVGHVAQVAYRKELAGVSGVRAGRVGGGRRVH